MKRYVLFTGNQWYPAPGWEDFRDEYDLEEDAIRDGKKFTDESYRPTRLSEPGQHDWWHVVDLVSGRIIVRGEKGKVTGEDNFPDHLKSDAPYLQCSGCGRKTFGGDYEGMECRMQQPFGNICGGTFEPPATL